MKTNEEKIFLAFLAFSILLISKTYFFKDFRVEPETHLKEADLKANHKIDEKKSPHAYDESKSEENDSINLTQKLLVNKFTQNAIETMKSKNIFTLNQILEDQDLKEVALFTSAGLNETLLDKDNFYKHYLSSKKILSLTANCLSDTQDLCGQHDKFKDFFDAQTTPIHHMLTNALTFMRVLAESDDQFIYDLDEETRALLNKALTVQNKQIPKEAFEILWSFHDYHGTTESFFKKTLSKIKAIHAKSRISILVNINGFYAKSKSQNSQAMKSAVTQAMAQSFKETSNPTVGWELLNEIDNFSLNQSEFEEVFSESCHWINTYKDDEELKTHYHHTVSKKAYKMGLNPATINNSCS